MNTPSHLIINAALARRDGRPQLAWKAWLLGAIAPDIPLYLLSLGGWLYYTQLKGWDSEHAHGYLHGYLYFNDPFWKAAHSVLHAPLVLIVLIGLGALLRPRQRWANSLLWFALSCLIHTTVDILTHAEDGPLLLFPLNWNMRFHSPVSYWDPRYYGRQFGYVELALDIALLGYLLWSWMQRRRERRAADSTAH